MVLQSRPCRCSATPGIGWPWPAIASRGLPLTGNDMSCDPSCVGPSMGTGRGAVAGVQVIVELALQSLLILPAIAGFFLRQPLPCFPNI